MPTWGEGQEEYDIKLLSSQDGLSQGSVYFMLRDSRDFMWFSSYEGLNRYDGKRFKQYLPNSNQPNTIRGNIVYGIAEDKSGNLWIGTEEGLNRMDRETENFSYIASAQHKLQQVHTFHADSSFVWYVSSDEGLVKYNFKTDTKQVLDKNVLLRSDYFQVFTAQYLSNDNIWLPCSSDRTGISRYNNQTKQVEYFFSTNTKNIFGKPIEFFCYYFNEKTNLLWFAMKNGLMCADMTTQKTVLYSSAQIHFENSYIYSMKQDTHGNLWLATEDDGVVKFSTTTHLFERLRDIQPNSFAQLNQDLIGAVYIDNEKDIVWANLEPQGILKISPKRTLFKGFKSQKNSPFGLSSSSVRCFTETSDGNIWIGTLGHGIKKFVTKTQQFEAAAYKKGVLPYENTFQLLADKKDNLWIGTLKGLYYYDTHKKEFYNYSDQQNIKGDLNTNTIRDIIDLPNHKLALAAENGVLFFDTEKKKYIKNLHLLEGILISKVFFDKDYNKLYVGTFDKGLYVYNIDNENIKEEYHILDAYTVGGFLSHENQMWLSSNKGLLCMDKQSKQIRAYTVGDGLPSNVIYNMILDNHDNFWLSSNRGISKFNIRTAAISNYSPEHGLQSYEYNINGYLKAKDGSFYFGGVNGVDHFFPDSILPFTYHFKTRIIDLKVNNLAYASDTVISEKKSIHLLHNEDNLQLHFQALDFFNNGINQYRYRLLPLQKEWIYTQSNIVDFAQLSPGQYCFQLQAATNSGSWNNDITSLNIEIDSPFWQKAWFRFLVLIGILLATRYLFLLRLNQKLTLQQLEFEKKQALEKERHRIASDMHDELGSGLSAIHLLSNYLKTNNLEPIIKKQIEKIAHHSALLALRLREIIWTMQADNEQLIHFSDFVRRYVLELDELQPVDLRFDCNDTLPIYTLPKDTQYQLLLCIKEAINNALKYAEANTIVVKMKVNNGLLMINIIDDGQGFDVQKALSKSGVGLTNIRRRMTQIKGEAIIEGNPNGHIQLIYPIL